MFCPIMLDISNRNCVVFGGGKIALRKIIKLIEYGAKVTVVSPKIIEEIKELKLNLIYGVYDEKYLHSAFLVIAATNDEQINKEIYHKSIEKNLLILNVNGKENSNIIFPAVKKEGNITIAVSTNGTSPAKAKQIRDNIVIPKMDNWFNKNFLL